MLVQSTDILKLEKAAEMLKAIAHPIRISMVSLLMEESPLSVATIHERLGIAQSVASHHLAIMKAKSVVAAERDGKNCFYRVANPGLKQLLGCIERCQAPHSLEPQLNETTEQI